jgi:hypothetical protein
MNQPEPVNIKQVIRGLSKQARRQVTLGDLAELAEAIEKDNTTVIERWIKKWKPQLPPRPPDSPHSSEPQGK